MSQCPVILINHLFCLAMKDERLIHSTWSADVCVSVPGKGIERIGAYVIMVIGVPGRGVIYWYFSIDISTQKGHDVLVNQF